MTSVTNGGTTSLRNVEQPYNSLLDQYSLLLDSVILDSPNHEPSVDNSLDNSPSADLGCFRLLLSNDDQQPPSTTTNIKATSSEESPEFQESGEKTNETVIQPYEDSGVVTEDLTLSKEIRNERSETGSPYVDGTQEQKLEESGDATENDLHLHLHPEANDVVTGTLCVDTMRERIPPASNAPTSPTLPKPSQLPRTIPTQTSQTLSKLSMSFHGIAQAMNRRVSVLAEQAMSHAATLAQPYTSTVGGFTSETALFVADRARLLADRYIRAIASDDPEVRHMQRMVMAREAVWGWMYQQSCFLSTLPWHLRRLLRETRDLDEAIEEALVASETEAKAKRQQQRAESRQESNVDAADESVTNTSSPPSSSTSTSASASALPSSNGNDQRKGCMSQGVFFNAATTTTGATTSSSSSSSSIKNSSKNNSTNNDSNSKNSSNSQVPPDVPAKGADVGVAGFHHWLLGQASAGDEEAQYAVTRWFTPPTFQEAEYCQHPKCGQKFGPNTGLFRHHCRHCGTSFCTEHSSQRRALLR